MNENPPSEKDKLMDTLTKQQATAQAILKRDRLGVLLFFVVWLLFLVGRHDRGGQFWILAAIFALFHGRSIYHWLRSRNWVLALTESCSGGETVMTISCVKTQLITHKSSKYSPRYLEAIRLITDNKETFLYVLPERVVYNGRVKETVNGTCIGRYTQIVCYSGTNMVKEIAHLSPEDMTWL